MAILNYSGVGDSRAHVGNKSQAVLVTFIFGKNNEMLTRSGFFYLLFIKNIAGRRQLGGKGHGRIQKNGNQKDAQENE
jgi:hypothetical protein